MLNAAADADLIGRSPARKVALPKIVRRERTTIDPLELRRLVDEVPNRYRALVLTAGVLGLAWEEAIALRVRDVDFMRRTVSVAQTVEELAGHLRIFPEGKRKARLRTMSAPTFVVDAIAKHLATCRVDATQTPEALTFLGPRGGKLRRRFGERILRPPAARAGMPGLTFHSLRHAATSSLVDIGVHPRVMASRIGHGTVRTTIEIYARSSDTADREAARLLQELFAPAFETHSQGQPRTGPTG
jgi:integrase